MASFGRENASSSSGEVSNKGKRNQGLAVPIRPWRLQATSGWSANRMGQRAMSIVERLRHRLSVLVLWSGLLALYASGSAMVVIGLLIASRGWWVAIHQHASMWLISTRASEALALGLGLLLILIVPVFHDRPVDRSCGSRAKQRTQTKFQVSVSE